VYKKGRQVEVQRTDRPLTAWYKLHPCKGVTTTPITEPTEHWQNQSKQGPKGLAAQAKKLKSILGLENVIKERKQNVGDPAIRVTRGHNVP
jgi:hypothetical protein